MEFLKKVRFEENTEENQRIKELNSHENIDETTESIISTQEMIQDARARRDNKVKEFQCDKCKYKSSSKTLIKNHYSVSHNEDQTKNQNINIEKETATKMRKRFSCEVCTFKTTNTNYLKVHMDTTHQKMDNNIKNNTENKVTSKRIHCDICGKKFNKQETFNKHIKNEHNTANTQCNIGRSMELNKKKFNYKSTKSTNMKYT